MNPSFHPHSNFPVCFSCIDQVNGASIMLCPSDSYNHAFGPHYGLTKHLGQFIDFSPGEKHAPSLFTSFEVSDRPKYTRLIYIKQYSCEIASGQCDLQWNDEHREWVMVQRPTIIIVYDPKHVYLSPYENGKFKINTPCSLYYLVIFLMFPFFFSF